MRPTVVRTVVATLAATAAVAAAGVALVVRGGWYDVSASTQHTPLVYALLESTLQHSVRRRAAHIVVPALDAAPVWARGATCFRDHCTACHGAPGVAPDAAALAMQPLAGPLQAVSSRWRTRELYWITRHGIRMTGMPAWGYRLSDDDLWAVVAFVERLPALSPADWRALAARLEGRTCEDSR